MDGIFGSAPTDHSGIDATLTTLTERFAATAAEHDRSGRIAVQNLAALHEAGLLGLTVDRRFGGSGAGLGQVARVIGRIAEGDPATALILAMHYLQLAAATRSGRWPEAVLRMVSQGAVRDGALINALRVEPGLGTPARGGLPETIARRSGASWRVSGRKLYSTGSYALRWGVVWGHTDEARPRVGSFLVGLSSPGISIEPSWNQLGMRATESHTVVLDDVAIPLEHAVDAREPEAWGGADAVQSLWGSVTVAALYDGIARAAHRWLLDFLRARAPGNLGAPLASLPRFHELVGSIEALLLVNRRLITNVVDAEARGEAIGAAEAGLIKAVVTDNAIKAVESGLAAIGNPGLSRDNPLERHYRDVLCARIHTPQRDAALTLAGRLALEAGRDAIIEGTTGMITRRDALALAAGFGTLVSRPARAADDLASVTLRVATYRGQDATLLPAAGQNQTPYKVEYAFFAGGNLQTQAINAGAVDLGTWSEIPLVFAAASVRQNSRRCRAAGRHLEPGGHGAERLSRAQRR